MRIIKIEWISSLVFGLAATIGVASEKDLAKSILNPGSLEDKEAGECGSYGTSVHFVKTPSEAARQALKEQKLVFVLHVSGKFETPEFT